MKNIFDNLAEIKEQIEHAGGAILLLDFDGVLSAIAETGKKAFISEENLALLKESAEHFPTAIITGRTMKDIKKKVNEKNIFYIASHGLEWEEDGKYRSKPIPKETIDVINQAKQKLQPLISRYPGMSLEDKTFIIVAHYRMIEQKLIPTFVKEVTSILSPVARKHKLRLDHNMKDFELRPEINWDKGDSAKFAEEYLNKKAGKNFIPIYIGDSDTDEDAFEAILGNGVGIRVNSKENERKKSHALWYMSNQSEVSRFLKWLLSLKLL